MNFRIFAATIFVLSPVAAAAQLDSAPMGPPAAACVNTVLISHDTPVILMATKEVSTADAVPGTRFRLCVHEPVIVEGRTIIPVGTPAFGTVVTATDAGGLGKSGRMTAKLLHIQMEGAEIPLEGETSAKGTGAGSAGVAVIFAGVMGLFHRGNNAKIKAGELVTGFVGEDVLLDLSAKPIARMSALVPALQVQP